MSKCEVVHMGGVGCVQVLLKGKACAAREGLHGVQGLEGLACGKTIQLCKDGWSARAVCRWRPFQVAGL